MTQYYNYITSYTNPYTISYGYTTTAATTTNNYIGYTTTATTGYTAPIYINNMPAFYHSYGPPPAKPYFPNIPQEKPIKEYKKNNVWHRFNAPAVIYKDRIEFWQYGKLIKNEAICTF